MSCFRYDGSTKEASFSIGLQGIAEEDAERVKQLISQTIDDVIEYVPIGEVTRRCFGITWTQRCTDAVECSSQKHLDKVTLGNTRFTPDEQQ